MPDHGAMTSNIADQQPPAAGGTPGTRRPGAQAGTPSDAADPNAGVAPGDALATQDSAEIPADAVPGGRRPDTGGAPGDASPPATTHKWVPLVTV